MYAVIRSIIKIIAGLMLTLSVSGQEIHKPFVSVQNVWQVGDETMVENAEAILTRMENGISVSIVTNGLEPGHVYTVWWVIMNNPQTCTDQRCGYDDVYLLDNNGGFILDEDGLRVPNFASREMIQFSELRATATIAAEDGTAHFRAHLPIGDVSDDVMFGEGLLDPMHADIHLSIHWHGPVVPERIHEQLYTAWGCLPNLIEQLPCERIQTVIFLPPNSFQ